MTSVEKKRSGAAKWFVAAGLLLVAAIAVFVGGLIWSIGSFQFDDSFPSDNTEHTVTVSTDGPLGLWTQAGVTSCRIDDGSGDVIQQDPPGGSFSKSDGSGSYQLYRVFDVSEREFTIACLGNGSTVQVGPEPSFGAFGGKLALTIGGPILLGLLAVAVGVVGIVKLVNRRPSGPAAGPPPPAPGYPPPPPPPAAQ